MVIRSFPAGHQPIFLADSVWQVKLLWLNGVKKIIRYHFFDYL